LFLLFGDRYMLGKKEIWEEIGKREKEYSVKWPVTKVPKFGQFCGKKVAKNCDSTGE